MSEDRMQTFEITQGKEMQVHGLNPNSTGSFDAQLTLTPLFDQTKRLTKTISVSYRTLPIIPLYIHEQSTNFITIKWPPIPNVANFSVSVWDGIERLERDCENIILENEMHHCKLASFQADREYRFGVIGYESEAFFTDEERFLS